MKNLPARKLLKLFMEKVIYFFRTKDGYPLITKTILRATLVNSSFLFVFFLLFNVFTYIILVNKFVVTVDRNIKHELEHFANVINVENGKIKLINKKELNEDDLINLNENSFFLQIYDNKGNNIVRSINIEKFAPIPQKIPRFEEKYFYEDLYIGNEVLRVVYKKIYDKDGKIVGYIQMAAFKEADNIQKELFLFNIFAFPVALFSIFIASIWLSKISFKPFDEIVSTAKKISASNLKERIKYNDENDYQLENLKKVFNNLFEKLEKQVNEISGFTYNASHQLLSPLTAMNSELEFILKKKRSEKEYIDAFKLLQKQNQHMTNIIKSLLLLSKGMTNFTKEKKVFDLSNLIRTELKQVYSGSSVKFQYEDTLLLRGEKEHFSIVIENLIDNAIKYSENKEVVFKAFTESKEIIIEVSDKGIGIPEEEKPKVFDKFYRCSNSLKKGIKGYGLGLSLVKSIVESMHGSVSILDNIPEGTIVRLKLPALDFE